MKTSPFHETRSSRVVVDEAVIPCGLAVGSGERHNPLSSDPPSPEFEPSPDRRVRRFMPPATVALPRRVVLIVASLCVLPVVLLKAGVPFAYADEARSVAVHNLLEWTALCVALLSVHFSFVQFTLRGDVSTPIIGAALFFSGTMDGFHALASAGLISSVADFNDFIPFTWAISRIVNASLIVVGASLLLRRPPAATIAARQRNRRLITLMSILFALTAYTIIQVCAVAPRLPDVIFPESTVPRPWDAAALILFLLAASLVLPRFIRVHPSLFATGLLLSMLPQIAAQCHAAFGSTSLFDGHANIASGLKILAYQVPFYGLMLDYRRAYQAEAIVQSAQEKLRIAREVQQGILPDSSPPLPGFDIAGVSRPADVMGGDFFDYVPLRNGEWAIVVADVSGHDIGASALMAQTRAYVRASTRNESEPSRVLSDVNRFIARDVREIRFCTMLFATLNPERRTMRYAGAGHNAWLLEPDDNAVEWPNTGPALGVIDKAAIAGGGDRPLPVGSLVVIATDGILEAESLGGVPFGIGRLLDSVRSLRHAAAHQIVEGVLQAVSLHTAETPQRDDLTLVIIKVCEPAEKPDRTSLAAGAVN